METILVKDEAGLPLAVARFDLSREEFLKCLEDREELCGHLNRTLPGYYAGVVRASIHEGIIVKGRRLADLRRIYETKAAQVASMAAMAEPFINHLIDAGHAPLLREMRVSDWHIAIDLMRGLTKTQVVPLLLTIGRRGVELAQSLDSEGKAMSWTGHLKGEDTLLFVCVQAPDTLDCHVEFTIEELPPDKIVRTRTVAKVVCDDDPIPTTPVS